MRTSLKVFLGLNVVLLLTLLCVVPTRRLVVQTDSAPIDRIDGPADQGEDGPQQALPPATTIVDSQPISSRDRLAGPAAFQATIILSTNSAALLPLVFQNPPPDSLSLNDQQLQVFADLQQRFVQDLGGANQDPTSLVYGRKWQPAQQTSDDLLEALLGGEFYVNYQLEVSRSSSSGSGEAPAAP